MNIGECDHARMYSMNAERSLLFGQFRFALNGSRGPCAVIRFSASRGLLMAQDYSTTQGDCITIRGDKLHAQDAVAQLVKDGWEEILRTPSVDGEIVVQLKRVLTFKR